MSKQARTVPQARPVPAERCPAHASPRGPQQGVVLVVALVILVVVSVIASVSMRNALSTENAAGTVRTTELATQAAEIALRHCEQSVMQLVEGGTPTMTTTFTVDNILPATSATHWQSPANWDNATTATFVLPLDLLNGSGLRTTYARPPECMVARVPVLLLNETVPRTSASFIVTARGFGPEVPAGTGRPAGSEIWLQSSIQLE